MNPVKAWNQFWFESKDNSTLLPLSLFRIAFCLVMFFFYFTRVFDVEFFYTNSGIMPDWHSKNLELLRYHPTFLSNTLSVGLINALHSILLLSLLFQAAGLFTRPAAILTYILHMAFLNRNMSVMFGVDMIGTYFLLYLCFADSNAYFSIDKRMGRSITSQSLKSHITWRLMQIQLCVVYAYSGLEKLKGTRWWDGSALWDVLSMGNLQRWDLSFVAHFPIVLAAMVYVVLIWEIYFPVLVWVPRLRLPMLLFGVLMHIGIFLFMNLPSFGFMMISLYILFLKKEEIEAAIRYVRGGKLTPSRN